MTSTPDPDSVQDGNCRILYDASLLAKPDNSLFSPDWLQAHAQVQRIGSGRGDAWFVDYQQHQWILRHYLRGGQIARLNHDLYLGWNFETTRAWQEWRLLHHMHTLGLPVPRPVAARACWPGSRFIGLYRADILLERIANTHTLAHRLRSGALDTSVWRRIGQCLKQFHQHDIYHADLNANNILLDEQDRIYLIDFDRGRICRDEKSKRANVLRLHRSLRKLQGLHAAFFFNNNDWASLLQAYADKT